jgi:hypothetical protein
MLNQSLYADLKGRAVVRDGEIVCLMIRANLSSVICFTEKASRVLWPSICFGTTGRTFDTRL